MPNELLTIGMITREALRLFRNSNWFLRTIGRQFDDQFGRRGAKIGSQLRIRLPNDYTVRVGPTAFPQGTHEQQTVLTLATQLGVDVAFSSAERELSLDDYSRRILAPAVNNLAGRVAVDIMRSCTTASNMVKNTSADGDTISPTAGTWLSAGALLDMMSSPRGDRFIVMDPLTQARTVTSLMGLFNPQPVISQQYMRGTIATDTLGFDWGMDQTVLAHQTGAYGTGAITVSGADQKGANLTVSGLGGGERINKGDIFTIADVHSVNRVTKEPNALLQQFVVMDDVEGSSATTHSIPIYPPIIPYDPDTNMPQPFQTVNRSPANNAAIKFATKPGEVYRKNFAYYAEAFTMATAELELPQGVHEAARETFDGISMRMITDYAVMSDQFITRLDILYGSAILRPEWIVAVADVP